MTAQERTLSKYPQRQLAIVTCMDTRLHPIELFDVSTGDAHVIANAGGRVSDDVLRSLVASTWLLGVRDVAVVQHTGCGMMAESDDALRAQLREEGVDVGDLPLRTIGDLEESVRGDVATLTDSGLLPDDATVRGYIVDIDTLELTEIA